MPEAIIVDVLNNQLFHSIVPELAEQICAIADEGFSLDSKFLPAYEKLKSSFATTYRIPDPENFTWKDFAKLFRKSSPFDRQLMLGPVLRVVMSDNIRTAGASNDQRPTDDVDVDVDALLDLTSLTEKGQYIPMHNPALLAKYLTSYFGYSIQVKSAEESQLVLYCERDFAEGTPVIFLSQSLDGQFCRYDENNEYLDCEQYEDTNLKPVADLFKKKKSIYTKVGQHFLHRYINIFYKSISSRPSDEENIEYVNFVCSVFLLPKYLRAVCEESIDAEIARKQILEQTPEILHQISTEEGVSFIIENKIIEHIALEINELIDEIDADIQSQQDLDLSTSFASTGPHIVRTEENNFGYTPDELLGAISPIFRDQRSNSSDSSGLREDSDMGFVFGIGPNDLMPDPASSPKLTARRDDQFHTPVKTSGGKVLLQNHSQERLTKSTRIDSQNSFMTPPRSRAELQPPSLPGTPFISINGQTSANKPIHQPNSQKITPRYSGIYLQQPPTESSTFWLRALQFSLAIGGVCAIIALLTCPPVASALGLTSILGVAVADIATTATFLTGVSALMSVSIFAISKIVGEDHFLSSTHNLSM